MRLHMSQFNSCFVRFYFGIDSFSLFRWLVGFLRLGKKLREKIRARKNNFVYILKIISHRGQGRLRLQISISYSPNTYYASFTIINLFMHARSLRCLVLTLLLLSISPIYSLYIGLGPSLPVLHSSALYTLSNNFVYPVAILYGQKSLQ